MQTETIDTQNQLNDEYFLNLNINAEDLLDGDETLKTIQISKSQLIPKIKSSNLKIGTINNLKKKDIETFTNNLQNKNFTLNIYGQTLFYNQTLEGNITIGKTQYPIFIKISDNPNIPTKLTIFNNKEKVISNVEIDYHGESS